MKYMSSEGMPQHGEMLLRFGLALVLLLAGIGKFMGGVGGFVDAMSGGFTDTVLPMGLVRGFLTIVPYLEVLIGIWLLVGYRRTSALGCAGVLLLLFLFGHMLTKQPFDTLLLLLLINAVALKMPSGCACAGDTKKRK